MESLEKNNLSSLGITTTKNYLEGGKLTIDEDKLRSAISEDPNAIYDMFMANGSEKERQRTRTPVKG
ncbi:flagellar filament capping protein FliD [Peribacillus frigoritolerans]|nr:flagellar filament capping protein FliD [Peribacillus frigoritolerans]